MLKRFFLSVIRNIRKDVYQSLLNIIGLTLGLTAVIYISTYIYNEVTFDAFHSKANRIYRVVAETKMGDTEEKITNSQNTLSSFLKDQLPEVEDATRLYFNNKQLLQVGNKKIIEKQLWYADDNIFNVFDFELLKGDKTQALSEPNSIVITEDFGKKYFGNISPFGKTMKIGSEETPYYVTGILKDIPKNSHIHFKALASTNSLPYLNRFKKSDWGNFRDLYTYALVKPNTNIQNLQVKFEKLVLKQYDSMLKNIMGLSLDQFEVQGDYIKQKFQKLTEIHLNKIYVDDIFVYGNKQLLYIIGAIGILILFVACFNFINLTTARSSLKAKEIGLMKVMGSSKISIIIQILSETFVISLLALSSSFVILFTILPILNSITGLSYSPFDLFHLPIVLVVTSLPFIIAVVAGLFPAFVISKYNPVEVMKGKANIANSHSILRNIFVTLQFIVFIMLIAGTLAIRKQLNYLRNHNPGFSKENILVIKNCEKLQNEAFVFKYELNQNPKIINSSFSTEIPSQFSGVSNIFSKTDTINKILLSRIFTDADFLKTLKINIKEGRFFSDQINDEQDNAIINTKAAQLLGWTDCSNKIIHDYNYGKNYNVIGIVDNFHLGSLKYEQLPVIIRGIGYADYLAVRIRPGNARHVVEFAREKWNGLNTKAPFEYFFLNNSFNAQYKSEEQLGKLVGLFSLISIIIACFGLVGLVSFATTRRQKEIGVRKVNGAKISEVLILLNKEFVFWILLAIIIATPIAWFVMNRWLENFANKTTISWWIYAIAGIMAICFALITVTWQSWKAATRNPVEALRDE